MLMITGAYGWEHDQWQGTYYPNEIATDWHLTFYAKEFQTALAPVSFWSDCSVEDIEEFCSDVTEDFTLIFEQNDNENDEATVQLQQLIAELVPNWIVFRNDAWQKEENNYLIKQAEIVGNKNLAENSAVFSVYSNDVLRDVELREIMSFLKKEFKEKYDVIYLFFDGALVSMDVLNTVKTLRKMLALD